MAVSTVRARTTAAAVLIGGLALVGAALGLVALLQQSLEGGVQEDALLRAQVVAATLESGTEPSALAIRDEDDIFIQVVDDAGRVVASSHNVNGDEAVKTSGPSGYRITEDYPIEDSSFLIVEANANTSGGEYRVILGHNLDLVRESAAEAGRLLALSIPILLIVVAATTWVIVGRALAPVEEIRREVTSISASELHRRVPVAAGDDEISHLASTMNDMLSRLERSRAKQEHLVSDASHELRNPIAAIRHHAEVALAHPEKTDVSSLAQEVLTEDLRLQTLAEDLLLLAKADEHTLQQSGVDVDIDDLVLEEAERLRKTTDLSIDTSRVSAARSKGDRAQLQRVVRNLADNAARHAVSCVRLSVAEEGNLVSLWVDDDGGGIPPDDRELVFERFTRLDSARDRSQGGAGLGLAIVREIVAAHGGSASVGDTPLGGAGFHIVLPRSGD